MDALRNRNRVNTKHIPKEANPTDEKLSKASLKSSEQRRIIAKQFSFGSFAIFLMYCFAGAHDTRRLAKDLSFGTRERDFPRIIHSSLEKLSPKQSTLLQGRKSTNSSGKKTRIIPMVSQKRLAQIADSDDYEDEAADPIEDEKCKVQYSWQKSSFPTCNSVHEMGYLEADSHGKVPISLLDNGYWRDVWEVEESPIDPTLIFKSMRYEHFFGDRNFDRNRRDAVALERLTGSPFILDIYSFCGNSGVFEYASEGSVSSNARLSSRKWNVDALKNPSLDILKHAAQGASGLAAVHNFGREGVASIAHTDIAPNQFVLTEGNVKLNDFNRARFIRWNRKKDEACPFHVGNNPGNNRSPEEYNYEDETEKIDVYSFGNTLYLLLVRRSVWSKERNEKHAQRLVRDGKRPAFPDLIIESKDPIHRAIRKFHIIPRVMKFFYLFF